MVIAVILNCYNSLGLHQLGIRIRIGRRKIIGIYIVDQERYSGLYADCQYL